MKVLFVGEGNHELGQSTPLPEPRPATGMVPTLARKISPQIAEDSSALRWPQLPRFKLEKKKLDRDLAKRGYDNKVKAAILVGALKFDCNGTVCVADADTAPEGCLEIMRSGRDQALSLIGEDHLVVCGLAYQSIDAWTLGAQRAIAEVLGLELEAIRAKYPSKAIEELVNTSGKTEHRPKQLVQTIAELAHRDGDTGFRQEVAERTNVAELENACPKGFKPFADQLRATFGSATGNSAATSCEDSD